MKDELTFSELLNLRKQWANQTLQEFLDYELQLLETKLTRKAN
jgi:hypothetical protein